MFTTPYQLTKSMHRDIYPAVDPRNPALSAKGKVVIVTGAGGGLGAVSPPNPHAYAYVESLTRPSRLSLEPGRRQAPQASSSSDEVPKLSS